VDLHARAVELVLERRLAEPLERGPGVIGGLRQHRLHGAEELHPRAAERLFRPGPREGRLCNRGHAPFGHDRAADERQRQVGGPGDRLGHEPLQRPLAELAENEPRQERLLRFGGAPEQLLQEVPLLLRRPGACDGGHAVERGVRLGDGQRRFGGGRRRSRTQERAPDADPPLAQSSRQPVHQDRRLRRRRAPQELGDVRDLVQPARRGRDTLGGLHDVGEAHGLDLLRDIGTPPLAAIGPRPSHRSVQPNPPW